MRVAIHQPNFFPWLGYFRKLAVSDSFIFLDDAEIQKTGSTWTNRTLLFGPNGDQYLTAPLDRDSKKLGNIAQVKFQVSPWREKMRTTLKTVYGRTPYFHEYQDRISALICNPEENLSEYNSRAILWIYKELELPVPKIYFSSELGIKAKSTERLVQLCKSIGATEYVYGGGAENYQENALFLESDVVPLALKYTPPMHLSANPLSGGYSVIDALFRFGTAPIREELGQKLLLS